MDSRKRKIITAVITVCLFLVLSVAVYAYLSASGGTVSNTFAPDGASEPVISEDFNDGVKTNVKVNVGKLDYAVYVRTVIVVTWENDKGEVYALKPAEGTDYDIELNVGDSKPWFEHGGFYYYRQKVDSTEPNTDVLIECCEPLKDGPEGYTLCVEIITQTIQALGTTDATDPAYPSGKPAVTDAWGIEVDSDDKLIDPNT